ncbi:MAG: aminodeoxychorismate synthase component I [Phycisphaerales bacterium]|nr:aminodeoxychorismate synthase component I [Phycisphaerales bacterium]
MAEANTRSPRLVVRELTHGPSVETAIGAFANATGSFVLESSDDRHADGRFTVLGDDPVELFSSDDSDWLTALARRVGPADPGLCDERLPFVGGWVGYLTYEAGAEMNGVPSARERDIALPRVYMALYDTAIVYDHRHCRWWVVGVDGIGGRGRDSVDDRLDVLEDRLRRAMPPAPIDRSIAAAGEAKPVMTPRNYVAAVERVKHYIAAGDVYQVNLTQRWSAPSRSSAVEIYRRVRMANPAPFAALLRIGETAIISASPELFLDLHDRRIVTRPIKGTRPRAGDDVLDAIRSRELLESEKDWSELTMIVDLMRNDLGRVCEFGSVRVVCPGAIEEHPSVYHLVATVEGRLRESHGWVDLLQSAFPGGSITGAPKIRAMQIIRELESTERSVYCGSIGWIGLDGSMQLNIAIRTMVLDRGRLHWFSGGAVVADSDADAEYAEAIAKVAGLRRALRTDESMAVSGIERHC